MRILTAFIAAFAFLCESATAFAQTPKEVVSLPGAQLFAVTGKVEVGKEGQKPASRSDRGTKAKSVVVLEAKPGEVISTGEGASASITLGNGAITGTARLGPDTSVKLPEGTAEPHSLELLKGRLFLNINGEQLRRQRQGEFRLKTPAALLAVKGTRFFAVADTQEILGTHEGTVSVTTAAGTVLLPAGKMLEINAGVSGQPRQMTPAEANVSGEYTKADLDAIPVHLATPSQKSAIKDGVILEWSVSRGLKGDVMAPQPTGERSEPVLGADGALRYSFNDPKTHDANQRHEMQADIILRGEARKLEANSAIAVTFLVRDPGWHVSTIASTFQYNMSQSNANVTEVPTIDKKVIKVTAPCGKISAGRFSEQRLTLRLSLPEREKGKTYEIEMWDFKVVARPE